MAFTREQLDALEKAIAKGVTRVRFADEEVQYRSLDEMVRIRNTMQAELGVVSNGGVVIQYPSYSKGLT